MHAKLFEPTNPNILYSFSKLVLSKKYTQAFVMRYNENVDELNQLVLNNNENKQEIHNALVTIPYNGKGLFYAYGNLLAFFLVV